MSTSKARYFIPVVLLFALVKVTSAASPSGSISASPNPCTVTASQGICTSDVSWTTANANNVQVWVGAGSDNPQLLLFAAGPSYTNDLASWIRAGESYTFSLIDFDPSTCNGGACVLSQGKILDSVTVTAAMSNVVNNPAVALPTANFTVNGASSINANVGDTLNYAWSSTNGTAFSSPVTTVPATCPGNYANWLANNANGTSSGQLVAGQAGCQYTMTYKVTNSAGTASQAVNINVSSSSVASGTNTSNASTVSSATYTALLNASNITAAVNIAKAAGLTVTGGVTSDGSTAYLVTRSNGTFVAALGHADASNAVGAPVLAGGNPSTGVESTCAANIGSGTAHVLTWPDGKIYGLGNTNYSLNVTCSSNDPVACSQTQSAANAGATNVAAAGGSSASGGGNATIDIAWVDGKSPFTSDALADANPTVLANGASTCKINIYTPVVNAQSNPADLAQILTHEIGHCMGLDHSPSVDSVMYPNLYPQENSNFSSDDKAVLAALRSGADIPVTNCDFNPRSLNCPDPSEMVVHNTSTNEYSCEACPSGTLPITDIMSGTSCRACPSGSLYQENKGTSIVNGCNNLCSAASGGYGPGYFYDVNGMICVNSCGPGQVLSGSGNQCVCAPGTAWNNTVCVADASCSSGFLSPNGTCTASTPESTASGCTTEQFANGAYNDSSGNCYTPATSTTATLCGDEGEPPCSPDSAGVGTCYDNNGKAYVCAATNCGDTGQPACSSNVPTGECVDGTGQVVACPSQDSNGNSSDICSADPTSPDCPDYCVDNFNDPSCGGSGDTGGTVGSGSGGGGGEGGCGSGDEMMAFDAEACGLMMAE